MNLQRKIDEKGEGRTLWGTRRKKGGRGLCLDYLEGRGVTGLSVMVVLI